MVGEASAELNQSGVGTRRRIGLNLLWLVPGEVGGSEEYSIGLLRAFAALAPADLDLIVYVNRRLARDHADVLANVTTVVAPISGSSRPLRVLIESTWLALRSLRDRVEVVHHAGGTMPSIRFRPGLVTLHDLQPITHPERFGLIKRTYIRLVAPRSLRRAVRVVCLSQFTAGDAERIAGVDPQRIAIVASGVDRVELGSSETSRGCPESAELLTRFGLEARSFILYPAITYDHKNHRTLVDAFARLVPSHPSLRLVLTGGVGSSETALNAQIEDLGLAERVLRTGRVAAADLDTLYRCAAVMAFPSSYEGFGLPLLEAMVRGCPVVTSAVGGLEEVGGAAVELVDPFDIEGWVAALTSVIDDPEHRAEMITNGLEQSDRYRWSNSALALAELYRGLPRTRVDVS
jgi:alpha-1,3-rhamnosyl/mannosyltransferase